MRRRQAFSIFATGLNSPCTRGRRRYDPFRKIYIYVTRNLPLKTWLTSSSTCGDSRWTLASTSRRILQRKFSWEQGLAFDDAALTLLVSLSAALRFHRLSEPRPTFPLPPHRRRCATWAEKGQAGPIARRLREDVLGSRLRRFFAPAVGGEKATAVPEE